MHFHLCLKKNFFIGVIMVSIIVVAIWQIHEQLAYAKPVGTLHAEPNDVLQHNINAFLEEKMLSSNIWVPGRENYHCSNTLYGYDEKYAYT